jgi:hypothetical protein
MAKRTKPRSNPSQPSASVSIWNMVGTRKRMVGRKRRVSSRYSSARKRSMSTTCPPRKRRGVARALRAAWNMGVARM